MRYIIIPFFIFLYATFLFIIYTLCFIVGQIAYTLWTLKFEWCSDNFWEYDTNGVWETDPKKIYPSVFHWAAAYLPKKNEPVELEITKEPFLNS